YANLLAGERTTASGDDLVGHAALARFVDLQHGLDNRQRRLGLAGRAHQRAAILGEARPAKAGPGMQEFAADAAIETDAFSNILDIGADRFAQIGYFVDESDLGGEKGISRVLDQFSRLNVGEQHRRLDQIERPIELPHHRAGRFAVGTDYNAVGAHKILDRRAFSQKFRV